MIDLNRNGEYGHLGEVGAGTKPLKRRAGLITICVLKGGVGMEEEKQYILGHTDMLSNPFLFINMGLCPCYLTFLNLRFLIFNGTILMI